MKYIKTKKGIFEYLDNFCITKTGLWEVATNCGNEGFFGRFMGEIVAQADTIEELVDEFICNDKLVTVETDLEGNLWIDDKLFEDIEDTVYGAIWIKGEHNESILKSVAKMCNKGELEWL